MQHEILSARPLLDKAGNLAEPGFAKKLLPIYRRAQVKASPLRLKEWDYYLVNNGRFALACALVSVLATLACFFHVTWWYLLTGVVILAMISLIYRDVLKEGISFVKRRFLNKNKGKTQ